MSLIFWHTENSVAKLKLFCFSKNIIKIRPKKITGLKFKNISFRERKKMSEEWMDRRKETVLNEGKILIKTRYFPEHVQYITKVSLLAFSHFLQRM